MPTKPGDVYRKMDDDSLAIWRGLLIALLLCAPFWVGMIWGIA